MNKAAFDFCKDMNIFILPIEPLCFKMTTGKPNLIRFILVLALSFPARVLLAQSGIFAFILQSKTSYTKQVKTPATIDTLYLPTDFASPALIHPEEAAILKGRVIVKIELVYTTFREVDTFNQQQLNYQRLLSLEKAAPELFLNNTIEWKLVAQTACSSSAQGKKTFHGFIVYLRPEQNEETLKAELVFLDSIGKDMDKIVGEDSILYFLRSKWDKRLGYVPDSASAVYFAKRFMPLFNIHDSTVLNVFERNKWKKMLVVVDVTGSMAQFSAQLMIWHKEHFKKKNISHFVFFNDGNQKKDAGKIPGATGGIYHLDASTAEDIARPVAEAMQKGNGGDIPENDVEAVLEGIRDCADCETIVLIADNLANMRDEILMKQISKPVKVILANLRGGINPQYLELARTTGGSVHTAYEDISGLDKLQEGAVVTLAGFSYKILNGKFVPLFDAR